MHATREYINRNKTYCLMIRVIYFENVSASATIKYKLIDQSPSELKLINYVRKLSTEFQIFFMHEVIVIK